MNTSAAHCIPQEQKTYNRDQTMAIDDEQDNLSKRSFNSSRKHDMEMIPTYAETKYLVDRRNNMELWKTNVPVSSESQRMQTIL